MKHVHLWMIVPVAIMLLIGGFIVLDQSVDIASSNDTTEIANDVPADLAADFPQTDFSSVNVPFEQILSGGPGVDGIPALTNPEFHSISLTTIDDQTRGLFVEIDDIQRFYPYNIMVWHEIVNDQIGDTSVAMTFCPLCGSAILFDRNVNGQVVEFGVSGYLFESNMIMYDRTETPTLWSQSRGEGIAGDQAGTKLQQLPFQLLELGIVKEKFPETEIMTLNTGHSRNYSFYPYGSYDTNDDLLFPVSVDDTRFNAKEIFYIIPADESSIALRFNEVPINMSVAYNERGYTATKLDSGEIEVIDNQGEVLPGYFEMWFSWATHHQDNGVVWDPSS